jgi:hypothetical protein
MKSRAVRLTLFLLFVIALGATAYLFWLGETRLQVDGQASRDYDTRILALTRDVAQIRSAQQAYVAMGQGDQFWAGRVATSLTEAQERLATLRAVSTSPGSAAAVDNAIAILQDFEQMDRRAREYVRNGQRLLASDLVFSDGLELTAAGLEALNQARLAQHRASAETLDGVRRRQLYAMGSAAAAALLVVLLLLPAGPRQAAPATSEGATSLHLDVPAAGAAADLASLTDEGWSPALGSHTPLQASSVALDSVATLCTELARISDTRALPALLEKSAEALNASGIVLWIADPDGRELSPIVTHGYSPTIVTRLGTIQRDAENATAAAFRTGLLQTVKADAVSLGAIAAPLVAPAGPVGVMAAEVRSDGEQDAAKLATATILAAQLATLVGPPSSRARSEAAG